MATAKDLDKYNFVSEPKSQVECPICLETLKTPKCLPCLHTFCEVCLHEYILTTHNDKDPVTFICPCCRKEFMGPIPDIPIKEWASKFPLNRFIIPMIQNQAVPETKTQMCGPCERDEDSVVARHWCSECEDAFCDICVKYHDRMKNNKSHKIMLIKDMEKITSEITSAEVCTEHEEQELVCYCKHHKTLCCKLCLLLSTHKACQTEAVEKLPAANPSLLEMGSLLDDMNDLDDRAKLAMLSQRRHIEVLNSSSAKAKERLSNLITVVKLRLDECHDKLNCALDTAQKEKTKQFTENENQIKIFRKVLSSGQKLLYNVKEQGDVVRQLKAVEKTKSEIQEEIRHLKPVVDEDKPIEVTLKVSDIFDTLNKLESVGELEVIESKHCTSVKPLFDAAEAFSNPVQQKPDIEKIRFVKLFDITTTEKSRWFTGGVFLKDDCLLFADRRNKKLRLYDSNGILKCEHQLNYRPWDVAIGDSSDKILVSDTTNASIRSYTVLATAIEEDSCVKVSNEKFGIGTIGDQILCVNGKNVEVIYNNGTASKLIQQKCEQYICASKTKKEYYCSYDDEVSCYSMAGNKVFVYAHQQLKRPYGMAVDGYGNIFVCGYDSGNIHIVSEDGKQSSVFSSKSFGKVTKPYSIAFNNTDDKLFIASCVESESIEIYKLLYN